MVVVEENFINMNEKQDDIKIDTFSRPIYDSNSELLAKNGTTGTRAPQYIAGLVASFSVVTMGTALAWTSQTSQDLMDGALGFPINSDELGWIVSLMSLGAAALALFSGSLCDLFGRKVVMLALIIPVTMGWSLIIWAQNVEMVYCGRFLIGMVAGAFCVLASLYNTEISQKEIRGAMGSYTQMMISTGILFSNVIAKFTHVVTFTIICSTIPIIFGIMFLFMPESPVYLLMKNRTSEARAVLLRLRGANYDIEQELKTIENTLWEKRLNGGFKTVKQSLKLSSSRKACLIGFTLMIYKTANGMDAVTSYTSYIFQGADIGIDPQIGTIILNTVQLVTGICQSLVVDRTGRRILLWLSGSVMTVCLLIVGLVISLKQRNIISAEYFGYVNWLPLVALAIFTVAFSLGLGPIPWLMLGEIFPPDIKTYMASFATFISKIATFGVNKLFLIVDTSWGGDIAFYIFAVITTSSVIFTFFVVPETKNKSFEEIQDSLK